MAVSIPCPHHRVVTYKRQVRPSAGVTINKAPKKMKLKIRALTQQQGRPLPVVDAPLLPVPIPNTQQFICQPTWSKVFLPTLTHLMFVSEYSFKSFKSKTSSFIANVQEAFNATYPHVSYRVTSGDDIAMVVRPCSWPCAPN